MFLEEGVFKSSFGILKLFFQEVKLFYFIFLFFQFFHFGFQASREFVWAVLVTSHQLLSSHRFSARFK